MSLHTTSAQPCTNHHNVSMGPNDTDWMTTFIPSVLNLICIYIVSYIIYINIMEWTKLFYKDMAADTNLHNLKSKLWIIILGKREQMQELLKDFVNWYCWIFKGCGFHIDHANLTLFYSGTTMHVQKWWNENHHHSHATKCMAVGFSLCSLEHREKFHALEESELSQWQKLSRSFICTSPPTVMKTFTGFSGCYQTYKISVSLTHSPPKCHHTAFHFTAAAAAHSLGFMLQSCNSC